MTGQLSESLSCDHDHVSSFVGTVIDHPPLGGAVGGIVQENSMMIDMVGIFMIRERREEREKWNGLGTWALGKGRRMVFN